MGSKKTLKVQTSLGFKQGELLSLEESRSRFKIVAQSGAVRPGNTALSSTTSKRFGVLGPYQWGRSMERRAALQRAPLAKITLITSGVVPYQTPEVWRLLRRFGEAGEWLGLATAEPCASGLLVSCSPARAHDTHFVHCACVQDQGGGLEHTCLCVLCMAWHKSCSCVLHCR